MAVNIASQRHEEITIHVEGWGNVTVFDDGSVYYEHEDGRQRPSPGLRDGIEAAWMTV